MKRITASFLKTSDIAHNSDLYMWDYGIELEIVGLDLPSSFEVHFECQKTNDAFVLNGTAENGTGRVRIPDECMQGSQASFKAWIYYKDAQSGKTVKTIIFSLQRRQKPNDYIYTPTERLEFNSKADNMQLIDGEEKSVNEWLSHIREEQITIAEIKALIEEGKCKGDKGDDGADGRDGADGQDGIGVDDISSENGNFIFEMTDGEKKEIPMPTHAHPSDDVYKATAFGGQWNTSLATLASDVAEALSFDSEAMEYFSSIDSSPEDFAENCMFMDGGDSVEHSNGETYYILSFGILNAVLKNKLVPTGRLYDIRYGSVAKIIGEVESPEDVEDNIILQQSENDINITIGETALTNKRITDKLFLFSLFSGNLPFNTQQEIDAFIEEYGNSAIVLTVQAGNSDGTDIDLDSLTFAELMNNDAIHTMMTQTMLIVHSDVIAPIMQSQENAATMQFQFAALEAQQIMRTPIDEVIGAARRAADNAQSAADNAQSAADNAQSAADNAQSAADNAQSAADNAQSAADNAQNRADSAYTRAGNAIAKSTVIPKSTSISFRELAEYFGSVSDRNSYPVFDWENFLNGTQIFRVKIPLNVQKNYLNYPNNTIIDTDSGVTIGIKNPNGDLLTEASGIEENDVLSNLPVGQYICYKKNLLNEQITQKSYSYIYINSTGNIPNYKLVIPESQQRNVVITSPELDIISMHFFLTGNFNI